MVKSILSLVVLWAVASLLGALLGGCGLLEQAVNNPDVEAGAKLMSKGVAEAVATSNGWESAGVGAAATGLIGLALTVIRNMFRDSRKRKEIWTEIKKIKEPT